MLNPKLCCNESATNVLWAPEELRPVLPPNRLQGHQDITLFSFRMYLIQADTATNTKMPMRFSCYEQSCIPTLLNPCWIILSSCQNPCHCDNCFCFIYIQSITTHFMQDDQSIIQFQSYKAWKNKLINYQ